MKTTDAWSGKFGDAYTERNRVDWWARRDFWWEMLSLTQARSIFELGCNAGWNLSAISSVAMVGHYPTMCFGGDINEAALEQAYAAGLNVVNMRVPDEVAGMPSVYELTFTAGVLIHVAPQELQETMEKLIGMSSRYVLAIEYEAEVETEIEYRGQMGLLWKRPYGELYQRMGLKLVSTGDAGEGFDDCTYWLMEK